MTIKKGFTLIELLVVVLIIGILAAIALPMYYRAVEKSRAAEALSVVKTLAEAEERFYLANGQYTPREADLDVTIPPAKYFDIVLDSSTYNIRAVRKGQTAYDTYHFRYFMNNVAASSYPGRLLCLHANTAPQYEQFCVSLGGTDKHIYKHMSVTQMAYYLK